MKGGGKPEPPFGWEVSLHFDIGYQKAFVKMPTVKIKAELFAQTAVRPVTSQKIGATNIIVTIRRLNRCGDMIVILGDRNDFILKA